MVRPVLGYWATIWLNGTRTQHNEKLLNGVQRLANVLKTGAMPSTLGVALDVITGNIPIFHNTMARGGVCQGSSKVEKLATPSVWEAQYATH